MSADAAWDDDDIITLLQQRARSRDISAPIYYTILAVSHSDQHRNDPCTRPFPHHHPKLPSTLNNTTNLATTSSSLTKSANNSAGLLYSLSGYKISLKIRFNFPPVISPPPTPPTQIAQIPTLCGI